MKRGAGVGWELSAAKAPASSEKSKPPAGRFTFSRLVPLTVESSKPLFAIPKAAVRKDAGKSAGSAPPRPFNAKDILKQHHDEQQQHTQEQQRQEEEKAEQQQQQLEREPEPAEEPGRPLATLPIAPSHVTLPRRWPT